MLGLEQLAELLEKNRAAAKARVKEFSIGGKHFAFNAQPAIMGVINLSPDSWYWRVFVSPPKAPCAGAG